MAKKKATEYAAAVDSYAADHSDLPSDDEDEDDSSTHQHEDDQSTASSSDAEERGGEEENLSSDEDDVEEESDDAEEENEDNQKGKVQVAVDPSITSGEGCTFDMKNLIAINSHQVSSASLYKKTKGNKKEEQNLTIPPDNLGVSINEDLLMEKASEGCTQLLSALWQLPMEKSDAGPMVTLPGYFEIKTPRSLVSFFVCCSFSRLLSAKKNKLRILTLIMIMVCIVYSSMFIASSSSQEGNQMGEICQRTRYSNE